VSDALFLGRVFRDAESPQTRRLGRGLLSQAGLGVALAVHFHLRMKGNRIPPALIEILGFLYTLFFHFSSAPVATRRAAGTVPRREAYVLPIGKRKGCLGSLPRLLQWPGRSVRVKEPPGSDEQ
jgi:hypothetical protein